MGDTSDLSEELVNTITNIYYFATKSAQQNLGGLSDLKDIFPARSESDLVQLYMQHMTHIASTVNHLPDIVQRLREIRDDDRDLGDIFEQVTIDMIKYGIEDAMNKTEIQRQTERHGCHPVEHDGLARAFEISFKHI